MRLALLFRNRNHRLGMHGQFVDDERVPDFDKERLHDSSLLDPAIGPPDTANVAAKTGDQKSLDRILVRGVAWTAAVKWLTQIFTWGTTVVVARLVAAFRLRVGGDGGDLHQSVHAVQ